MYLSIKFINLLFLPSMLLVEAFFFLSAFLSSFWSEFRLDEDFDELFDEAGGESFSTITRPMFLNLPSASGGSRFFFDPIDVSDAVGLSGRLVFRLAVVVDMIVVDEQASCVGR